MGENKNFIFNGGAMGVESAKYFREYNKQILEKNLDFKFDKKNILMTFHPETKISKKQNIWNLKKLLNCLKTLKDTSIIITLPGADQYYKEIYKNLENFRRNSKNVFLFKSLGHDYYFSICKLVDLMIGNSSSGIIEMPTFKKATINLGFRQSGRLYPKSVINVEFKEEKILKAINKVYSKEFIRLLKKIKNPYENKNSSDKILKILKRIDLKKIKVKEFIDYKLS
jgi:GDP/UDP-N,N'-diacetylbacillosamine 2-epimerase (hydrolysing)